MRHRGRVGETLDAVDAAIVAALTADGRLSVRALADRVSISRASAYQRLERLQRAGVITGFTAVVDPVRAGLTTTAYVTLSIRQQDWREMVPRLRAIEEVRHMALTGGDVDVVLLVRAADNEALRRVVLEQITTLPGVLSTRTLLVFEDHENR